ncbi:MAG: VanZ family protein [Alkaliphilus sp.]|nr:VanZ family protein [bacterium AH-315-E09]PHS30043.1 MAG: VanZ family protein [Alkaliphilus sp.]
MNKKQIIISISWLAVLLWMVLIFNLSSQPANQSNKLSEGITKAIVDTVERVAPSTDFDLSRLNHIVRKNAHFFAYLVLALLVMNAVRRTGGNDIKLTLLICVLYAISDEMHQIFIPGRSAQLSDVLIDSVGVVVGIVMYLGISGINIKKLLETK